jgi:DNA-directed RNA polymerase specialized sigma24 family protein
MSYREIAAELGCTHHAVKKYITKALSHVRTHLSAEDPALPPLGS